MIMKWGCFEKHLNRSFHPRRKPK